MNSIVENRYISNDYLASNPSYHEEDGVWKAARVAEMMRECQVRPTSLCDIGCGSGRVLFELRTVYPAAELYGYDIAPNAMHFWGKYEAANIHFQIGDFRQTNRRYYDVVLLLDVIEHLANPEEFLTALHGAAKYYILHVPLDLSALAVILDDRLLNVRQKVGHLHFFTKDLALSLMRESGFEVISWHYTGVASTAPNRNWKSLLRSLPGRLARGNKDWWVKVLGGETLLILARSQSDV
jgi:SAM-dependent methyltransferase